MAPYNASSGDAVGLSVNVWRTCHLHETAFTNMATRSEHGSTSVDWRSTASVMTCVFGALCFGGLQHDMNRFKITSNAESGWLKVLYYKSVHFTTLRQQNLDDRATAHVTIKNKFKLNVSSVFFAKKASLKNKKALHITPQKKRKRVLMWYSRSATNDNIQLTELSSMKYNKTRNFRYNVTLQHNSKKLKRRVNCKLFFAFFLIFKPPGHLSWDSTEE